MITLKLWNSMTHNTRRAILGAYFGEDYRRIDEYCKQYHHNFDYDSHGKTLKEVLSCCNKQKDGSINVVVNIKPQYEQVAKTPAEQMAKVVAHTHDEVIAHCEYCGKPLSRSDVNDFGSLCEDCYMKEYYD